MTTREKIMEEALNQFSVKGFGAVSVRDIAYAVGIKESSLYNHYKNKQDIFDSIIREYTSRMDNFFYSMKLTGADKKFNVDERAVAMYKSMTPELFLQMASGIFDYYFTDEITVKLRRMLTIEQYRDAGVAEVFREISFDSALNYQSAMFKALMDAGLLVKADPYVLALEFFSPVFLVFYKYENDAQSLAEAKELVMKHIMHFYYTYTIIPDERETEK